MTQSILARSTTAPPLAPVTRPDDVELARLRRENQALRQTLESRKLVERAKGLLMSEEGLSEPEAFRRIQKTSMDTRTPMADVARALLLAGEVRRPPSRG